MPLSIFCQNEYMGRLESYDATLAITPTEEIWVLKDGKYNFAKHFGESYQLSTFVLDNPNESTFLNNIVNIYFFNEDTLIATEGISKVSSQNFIYWSGDHGNTWQRIIFGEKSSIDVTYITNNGKVWMSGSSQLIYYSEDFGKTWTTFKIAEPSKDLVKTSIHFAKDEKTGLFITSSGCIYKTNDNFKHWEKIATPDSQNKYEMAFVKKTQKKEKVRIFGDFIIINQYGKVFITKSNNIDWTYQPTIKDFEVTENDDLYVINEDLTISLYNYEFKKIWQSDNKIKFLPYDIKEKNNKLFVLCYNEIFEFSPKEFCKSPLLSKDISIEPQNYPISFEDEEYGYNNWDVLRFNKEKKKWYRFMTLDFSIIMTVFEKNLLVTNIYFDKHYCIDTKNKTLKEFPTVDKLFANDSVNKVIFLKQSDGCFHSTTSKRVYLKKGNKFVLDNDSSSSNFLIEVSEEIDYNAIRSLVETIDKSRFSKVSLSDLNITDEDIKQFKEFINKEKELRKNPDYDNNYGDLYIFPISDVDLNFYKAVADSLTKINDDMIDKAFWQFYGSRSTTNESKKIIFVFQNGKELRIENGDGRPNYFYCPWAVYYEGFPYVTNSILIGQQIDKITNGQFFNSLTKEKKYAIFIIADYLYRKKINRNLFPER